MRPLAVLAVAAIVAAALPTAPARAQLATTTFVSGFGFDTNPCTVAAPCRSFQHAHDLTAAGGQITMLDPAGYSVVSPAATAAVTISDTIVSNNSEGVEIAPSGGTVNAYLERVTAIANISVGFNIGSAGTIQAVIVDSAALDNGLSANGFGFILASRSAETVVSLINSKAVGNHTGLGAGSGTAVMSRVTLSGSVTDGFEVIAGRLETFGDNYIIDTSNSGTLVPISEQ